MMKCQVCHDKEANIIFTQIVNGEKMVLHICSDCAQDKGISMTIEKPSHPKMGEKSPHPKVASLIGGVSGGTEETDTEAHVPDLTCNVCGLTFSEFRKTGLFGCDACHVAFGEHIPRLLKQIHGTDVYGGKTPGDLSDEGTVFHQLKSLRMQLKQCVDAEDYERAAVLRDKIGELETRVGRDDL